VARSLRNACKNISGEREGVYNFSDKGTVSEEECDDFNDFSLDVEL